MEEMIIYELHVGSATPEGTFRSLIHRLDYLLDLGVNTLELMPVAQFPGSRNWGYDGVYPYAPQNSYGGPEGLKTLVNACHSKGLAVILDVVYNHLGPEGNYLSEFGPYFTDRYHTPWGAAVNFDGSWSDEVRNYFVNNAVYWAEEFHIDGLRLDAVHGTFDFSARHILSEIAESVHSFADKLGRHIYVIAESDLNDARIITPVNGGGYGLDAQWNDDFHHCLHVLLTGERSGYYADFNDSGQLEKAYAEGFVYSGQHSAYRNRRHGNSSKGLPGSRFVVFSQNHDQVGNRALGDRLSVSVTPEKLRLAAAAVILAPFLPLIFMGEEYGEVAPFLYFVSHSDPELVEAVRDGRKKEFASFGWTSEIADPQAEATFLKSKLSPELYRTKGHALLHHYYRELITIRKRELSLSAAGGVECDTYSSAGGRLIALLRSRADEMSICVFNFDECGHKYAAEIPGGEWKLVLDSASPEWGGRIGSAPPSFRVSDRPFEIPVEAMSAVVYSRRIEVF